MYISISEETTKKTLLHKLHFDILPASENAVVLQFGTTVSEDLLSVITSFDRLINDRPFDGFIESIPGYTTLTLFYDPLRVGTHVRYPGCDTLQRISHYLYALPPVEVQVKPTDEVRIIPVCYRGRFAPDLDKLADMHGIPVDDIVRLHTEPVYLVHLIGFVPGFAYLGGLNKKLASPRKEVHRKSISAGSVGIAGEQTGIYPLETPGGWQLIGRTPVRLFDASRNDPSLLKAGDRVVFREIDEEEFAIIFEQAHANTNH